jgi:polyisoprenoid-binding protein YceI
VIKWVIRGAIAVVVLAVLVEGATFAYIHFIEGPAPKSLSLPATTSTVPAHGAPVAFPTGSWDVTSASTVGYRVHEVLFGQDNVAVGRTHSIKGSIALAGTAVNAASFTVQMSTVHSDQSERDTQFDGRIMDVAEFPTSRFTLTSPIALGHHAAGTTITATATGDLTLRGQTHAVTLGVSARYSASSIDINGDIGVTFATWGIPNPGFAGITTDNHGTLEFLLVLHPAT